ncbi:MAG: nuclear transport factor 2 family protein [Pseudomonadales bacterium]
MFFAMSTVRVVSGRLFFESSHLIMLVALLLFAFDSVLAQGLKTDSTKIERVRVLMGDVLSRGRLSALDDLVSINYQSHYPVHSGAPAENNSLEDLRSHLKKRGRIANRVERIIADGDYVFAQVHYLADSGSGSGSGMIGGDVFRFGEDNKIHEHWLVRQPMYDSSEHQQLVFSGADIADKPTVPETLQANKNLVRQAFGTVWAQGRPDRVPAFFAEHYIQHNPYIASGAEHLQKMIALKVVPYIQIEKQDYPLDVLHIGAQGDFVFLHLETVLYNQATRSESKVQSFEIVRVNSERKLAEHWDILQIEGVPFTDLRSFY